MMKLLLLTFAGVILSAGLSAQISVSESPLRGKGVFTLASGGKAAEICCDASDHLVVARTAGLFAADVEMVTGVRPRVTSKPSRGTMPVIVGTIEKSACIKELVSKGKIDVAPLQGAWERYLIQLVDNPFPGVGKALVVAGSDRRGAAYGLLALSEAIGVSPWYWWADVPVARKKAIHLRAGVVLSDSPSVRYRGVFINDEDWGLTPWAAKTFEPERKNIGPKTYARMCELLLRLKANYLAPAMHPVSTAFNAIPENKMVADTFAIVMGSTHCEPLLLNTASEWDKKTMGEWDYAKNKDKILEVLTGRVKDNGAYENVYTLALRGLHDASMVGRELSMQKKVEQLGEALMDQRNILVNTLGKRAESIPQAFTPYKEVLEIYVNGLKLPDDVTIVWPDDNYGYMKQLSNPAEQKRSGRSGVYYHVSYLGVPHSYMWFSTTPPSLMYEELRKAYDTSADRLWLVNCGDLKACEMQVSMFLDMAYDIDAFDAGNAATYPARWLAGLFGQKYYADFDDVYGSHINLSFVRKPEYMGWGHHWNSYDNSDERLTDTEFSIVNYSEADRRLAEYSRIAGKAAGILASAGKDEYAAMFQLFYYPVKGAELINRMTIGGQRNRLYARQQRARANVVREQVKTAFDSLYLITDQYNNLLDGKWKYVITMKQNYGNIEGFYKMPEVYQTPASGAPSMALFAEQEGTVSGVGNFHVLPAFNTFLRRSHWVDLCNKGGGEVQWKARPSAGWIVLDRSEGRTASDQRVTITVDWGKAPSGGDVAGHIDFEDAMGNTARVLVPLFNPQTPSLAEVKGLYVQDNGYVSIPAAGFHRQRDTDQIKMSVIKGMGIEGESLQMGDPAAPLQNYRDTRNVPWVEYDFYTFDAGIVDVYTYVLPTFPLHSQRDFHLHESTNFYTRYSVRIDKGAIAAPTTSAVEYSQEWYECAERNFRVNKSTMYVDKPGRHTLQIRTGDPGTIIQKIVIDLGGLKRSYLGPQSTRVN